MMYTQRRKSTQLKSNINLDKIYRMICDRWQETCQAIEARSKA
jgi:hypothetical protein